MEINCQCDVSLDERAAADGNTTTALYCRHKSNHLTSKWHLFPCCLELPLDDLRPSPFILHRLSHL